MYSNGSTTNPRTGETMYGAIDERTLKAIILAEVQDARELIESSEVTERRRKALNYYYGRPYGDELPGRSAVVVPDVRNSVEWLMPSLMKMYATGDRLIEYVGTSPLESQMAREATIWVNTELRSKSGKVRLAKFLKSLLLEATQVGKVYADVRTRVTYETWDDVSIDVIWLKMQADGLEVASIEPTDEEEKLEAAARMTGALYEPQRFNVTVVRTARSESVCFHGVPSENTLVTRRYEIVDDDIPFIGELCQYTKSDLIAMGFDQDVVMDLPAENPLPKTWGDGIELERYRDEGLNEQLQTLNRPDWQSDRVWLLEAYALIDCDDDGIAERQQIYAVGDDCNTILSVKPFAGVPFFSADPIPLPHKLVGLSQADMVVDWQRVDSAIVRNLLDNVYQTTNPRLAAVEDQVEIDDLLDNTPGAVVRVRQPGMIEPIIQTPLGAGPMQLLEWCQGQVESTGTSKLFQGVDANSINETSSGMGMMMSAAQARVTLIGLMLEPAFERMGMLFLRAAKQSGLRKKLVPYGNSWVQIDPAIWNENMHVRVRVGLGVGQQRERTELLNGIAAHQKDALAAGGMGYLVNGQNFFNTARELLETNGLANVEDFFVDPHGAPAPPPAPDSQMILAQAEQMKAETDRENKKLRAEIDAANNKMNYELALQKMQLDHQLKLADLESRQVIALANVQARKTAAQTTADAHKESATIAADAQRDVAAANAQRPAPKAAA